LERLPLVDEWYESFEFEVVDKFPHHHATTEQYDEMMVRAILEKW